VACEKCVTNGVCTSQQLSEWVVADLDPSRRFLLILMQSGPSNWENAGGKCRLPRLGAEVSLADSPFLFSRSPHPSIPLSNLDWWPSSKLIRAAVFPPVPPNRVKCASYGHNWLRPFQIQRQSARCSIQVTGNIGVGAIYSRTTQSRPHPFAPPLVYRF
jgi:hypothetical protein